MGILANNYLHLWYGNFDTNGNMANIISQKKEEIKRRAIGQIQTMALTSGQTEKEYEKLYGLTPKDFNAIPEIPTNVSDTLVDFDNAVGKLKTLLKEHGPLVQQRANFNKALSDIESILQLGANTGFVTESAMNEIKSAKETILEAKKYFANWAVHDSKEGKTAIDAALKTLESGTAGYLFEFAHAYGKAITKKKGLTAVHELFINIGGSATLSDTLRREGKEDPEFEKALNELADALDINNGQQAKGDQVLMYHEMDGQGQVIGETKFVVFQNKNFKKVNRVHVFDTTFGQLDIEQEFGTNEIVNIAGGLGNNAVGYAQILSKHGITRQKGGIGFKNTSINATYTQQKTIDSIWRDIRESMKLLAISDAIAGDINSNLTMQPNYYVIREKYSGEIRVVGVSRILNKIKKDLEDAATGASMGIGWNYSNEWWTSSTRDKYWMYNIGNFMNTGSGDMTPGELRSSLAYPHILQLINAQKISIALNFSNYFSQS